MSSPTDLFNPTPTHADLRTVVCDFTRKEIEVQARAHDEAEKFNQDLFEKLGQQTGLFGLTVSEELGGHGLDAVAEVIVHEEMSYSDPAFTLSYLAHEILFVNNLFASDNDFLKKKYLPFVLDGKKIAGMCMTEPSAGTDVLGLKSVAKEKSDHFILNGSKQFITNAPEGEFFIVYAKLDHAEKKEITSFIVESSFKGFKVGKKEEKMGMRASSTAVLYFEDVEVPKENLLSAKDMGITSMMRNLEIERVTLAAQSLGIAKRCIDDMCLYAFDQRQAFGKALSAFGQIQMMIAESYALYEAARALVYNTATHIHPGNRNSIGAASAKLVATNMAEKVARNAIQVLGGYGYCREYPVERMLRDAILLSIGGGTNEAMQKNIVADLRKMRQN